MSSGLRRMVGKTVAPLVALWILAAFVLYAHQLKQHLPFEEWAFPRYLAYFTAALAQLGACVGFGLAVQELLGLRWPWTERLIVAGALGSVIFAIGWSVLGFVGAMNGWTFYVWPILGVAVGTLVLLRGGGSWRRRLRILTGEGGRSTWFSFVATGAGFVGLLLVYAPIMTPQNVAFDARWYHLPLAERFALEGGIVRFPEGWILAGYPPLPSLLYSWAFSLPGVGTFDRVELAAHLEFVWFVITLSGIPILTRKLLRRVDARMRKVSTRVAWVTLFLFPGIFVYDSSLSVAADHLAAAWAIPFYLIFLRAERSLGPREMIALGACVTGILLTKYTAYGLVVGPAVWLLGRFVVVLVRGSATRRPAVLGVLAFLGLVLIGTTPHWLKNLIFYGDPLFPALASTFEPHPWTSEAPARLATLMAGGWRPSAGWQGVTETLEALPTFSFSHHDWPTFHGAWPVFGSLFTLLAPIALVVRNRRLLGLYLAVHASLLYWFVSFHQDRYLQIYVPWMAVATSVLVIQVWAWSRVLRLGLCLLIALQVVWGGDAPFFGTHTLAGQPLEHTIAFLRSGFDKKDRFVAYREWENIRRHLPAGSRVLRHENQVHLGIGHPTVTDWFQTGLSYGKEPEAGAMFDLYEELGVTHLLWQTATSRGFDSWAADIAFFHFASRHSEHANVFGPYTVARLSKTRPNDAPLFAVYLACDSGYSKGLYDVRQLNVMPWPGHNYASSDFARPLEPVEEAKDIAAVLDRADALVHDPKCMKASPRDWPGFAKVATRANAVIYVRH